MSEPENTDDEETLPENEYEYEFEFSTFDALKIYLIKEIKSAARQFLCSCSVMIFPALSILYEKIPAEIPQLMANDEVATENTNHNSFHSTVLKVSTIGYIISGITLSLIGRKYTVIVANLLHLAILIYSYIYGIKNELSYPLSLVYFFVKEFALVPFVIYVAEISSPNFRAIFFGLYSLIDALAAKRRDKTIGKRRNVFLIYAIVTSFSLLLALFVPETPFWKTLKGNPEKAEETFLWLRANQSNISSEFDQMMVNAENLKEKRAIKILKYLASLTFVLGVMFSCSIALCSFNPCFVIESLLYDLNVPPEVDEEVTEDIASNGTVLLYRTINGTRIYITSNDKRLYNEEELCVLLIGSKCPKKVTKNKEREMEMARLQQRFPAISIFLFSCFLIRRKILFLVSYALGIFIITVITRKLASLDTLITISAYCYSPPYLGVAPLSMILPVEIYPTALREIGVVISAILVQAVQLLFKSTSVTIDQFSRFPIKEVAPKMSYICYYGSLIGILFIVLFMPETRGTSIYESNKLTLSVPFRRRRKIIEDAEEEGDESAMGVGERTVKE